MGTGEAGSVNQLNQVILKNFKCFMTRVAKLEELGSVGGRFLGGFHQSVEFLRRDSRGQSPLTEGIIKANGTRWVRSYVESGCVKEHEIVQNMIKSKSMLKEIEEQLEDLGREIQTAYVWLLPLSIKDTDDQLDQGIAACQGLTSPKLEVLRMTDYDAMMAVVYIMLKQDYVMQEKIVTSLNLKSTSGELESYSLMWSLRPSVDVGIMHQAWKLV